MPTTKTLYLIRHSKAEFPSHGISDLERPLSVQGVIDSHRTALELVKTNVAWDLVISSPAFRAINTAIIFSRELGFPISGILLNKNLYESKVKNYLDIVNSIGEEVQVAALFGHNETISDFASYLTGKPIDFPTSGVAMICISDSWSEASGGTCTLLGQY